MNVALSRAKSKLILIGNKIELMEYEVTRTLVLYLENNVKCITIN